MAHSNIGNELFRLVNGARGALFNQGELTQLTYGAFDAVAANLRANESPTIEISYPVGYRVDKTAILSTKQYTKEELLSRYQFLAFQQMPINGLAQIVTIVEALLGDIVRAVIVRFPQKLGGKRAISLQVVLGAQSLEEVHMRATDALLNELSYKSPSDFAASVEDLLSIRLYECPAFHRYVELKATRDIHVHNRGFSNDTYLKKAGSHARANSGSFLPVDIPYFLESYESCLQLTEWLEKELHECWHSSDLEDSRNEKKSQPSSLEAIEVAPNKPVDPAESVRTEPKKKRISHKKTKVT